MATTNLEGNTISLTGEFPKSGDKAPNFTWIQQDLSQGSLADFAGKKKVLNIFPSIDTGVCATSVRTFNQKAAGLANTVVLCISYDLPFAQHRFCGAEGIENVITGSLFRTPDFGTAFGVGIADGPLAGLTARAVLVLDENDTIVHAQLVDDITHEPDYDKALSSL